MLVFLSHSGSDTDAARALKKRIAAAPAAREAGLELWLDVDELRPGDEWQPALEAALERADAFMVYVGAKGVVNWVDRELRHAMTRATGPSAIPFVPVLASDDLEPSILPPFVRQFQAATDPLGDDRALAALVSALVSGTRPEVALTDRPFVGLAAMDEAEADRFFGRDAEIAELTALLKRQPLVAVVADSGAGKSSLVRAGLVPAFRGGALLPDSELASPAPRHVVVMRPGADPVQGLKDGVDRAARALGRDAATRRSLRQSVRAHDPGETFYALACDIDHEAPDILLVIDQFEELLTATPPEAAAEFVRLLLDLIGNDRRSVRVVLTVRVDYFNLIRRHAALFDRLEADGGAAQFRLKGVSDEGLDEIVKRPLIMAGHRVAAERDALAEAIRRDITERPGDLALVQMALYATWRRAVETAADLMTAYAQVNGVLGALAHQAEETRHTLGPDEQEVLVSLFARLVRLGDTGGATRRIAILSDLDPARGVLARRLATEEAGRLLMIGDETVEIAHEALVAQWPWLQDRIQSGAADIRTLARLGDRTATWKASGAGALPNEIERRAFEGLAERHGDWLSVDEHACLAAARRRATLRRVTGIAAMLTIVAFGVTAGVMAWRASVAEQEARDSLVIAMQAKRDADRAAQNADMEAQRATAALAQAARNAAGGLVALSTIAANAERWEAAIKLALAAWPRRADGFGVQLPDPIDTLSRALPAIQEPQPTGWEIGDTRAEFSPDGRFVVHHPGRNAPLTLRNSETGEVLLEDQTYPHGSNLAFSPDGRFFSASTQSGTMWLVDLRTSQKTPIPVPSQYVTAVAFSPDGETLYGAVPGGLIYMFPTALPDRPAARMQMGVGADPDIWTLAASPDGVHLAVGRRSGLLEIWNVGARSMVAQKQFTIEEMGALRFSDDGRALIAFFRRDPVSYRIVHANDLEQLDFGGNQPVSLRGNNYAGDVISETAMALSGNLIYAPFRRKLLGGEFDGVAEIMLSELPGGPSPSNGAVAGDRDVPHDNSGAAQRDTRALPLERPGMRVAARLGWTDTLGQPHATCLELSPDGERLAVADQTGRLSLWSLESGAMLSDYDLSMGPVMDMAYLSDSSLGVIDASGRVRIIDLSARPDRVWWTPPDGAADDLWLSPDWTRMATRRGAPVQIQDAPADERVVAPVRVWDLPSGDPVATLNDVDPDARFVLSPGGTRLAALAYRDLLLFDLTDAPDVPDPVRVTADRSGSIDAKAFSDDGRIFSMAGGSRMAGHVAAFDTETGERILNADYHRAGIGERILFSDDGKALGVTGGRGDSVTWFALDGSNAQLDKGYPVADDNPVRDFLVNLASGYPGGERGVLAPDNRRLAVLHNGAVDIYDTATGTVLATLRDRFGALVAMHYPDPGTLHAVTDEGRIGTWNLSALAKGTAFDVACRLLLDPSLEDALRGYPIIQEDPICGPDYAPPLPAWMDLSHAAIGYTP